MRNDWIDLYDEKRLVGQYVTKSASKELRIGYNDYLFSCVTREVEVFATLTVRHSNSERIARIVLRHTLRTGKAINLQQEELFRGSRSETIRHALWLLTSFCEDLVEAMPDDDVRSDDEVIEEGRRRDLHV